MLSKLSTNNIKSIFLKLGLSSNQAKIYTALLESGTSGVGNIAKTVDLPRSTVYLLLDELVNQGLTSRVKGETKLIYTAVKPTQIETILLNRIDMYSKSLPQVREISVQVEKGLLNKTIKIPKVRYYEGNEGLRLVYSAGLQAEEILIICQGNPSGQNGLENDPPYLKEFIAKTTERGVRTREILEENPASIEYEKKFNSDFNQILVIPEKGKGEFGHVDKHIYSDEVAYISHDNKIGLIIEDKDIAASERAQFEVLWNYWKVKLGAF